MFCAKISGEHLQGHWSSGFSFWSISALLAFDPTLVSKAGGGGGGGGGQNLTFISNGSLLNQSLS